MPPFRVIQVFHPSTDFRAATKIVEVAELPTPLPGHVVVQNHYLGINATDINVTNNFYGKQTVPFGCGLESIGIVTAVADDVSEFQPGDAVAVQMKGAFAEYVSVSASVAVKIPRVDPAVLPVLGCGVAGALAMEKHADLKSGDTILVTAAAGGTGQFVVQLAKRAGAHVIGLTSSDEKASFLKALGVDRTINYNKETLSSVLKNEYPGGVNVVFETIGGETLKTAVENIAVGGRIVMFGFTSSYEKHKQHRPSATQSAIDVMQVTPPVIFKSASLRGFALHNHLADVPRTLAQLLSMVEAGELIPHVDKTIFLGLEGVADAIDHLYARKNIGKVVVRVV